jgi:hypothetical protein
MSTRGARRWLRPALLVIGNALVLVILLALIEGLASLSLLAITVNEQLALAERLHTTYDPELGWANRPNVSLPNLYGTGRSLHTNARGFRGTEEVSAIVAPGRRRVICSGDSFALGYGVDDRDTWCRRLSDRDPRLETVNMGQGGYGIDQAYLWYKRDAAEIEHQLHLFSFVTHDVHRMQSDTFLGYGKPVLTIVDGALVVENVPVPRWPYLLPWLTRNLPALSSLRIVGLAGALGMGGDDAATSTATAQGDRDLRTSRVIRELFRELAALNRKRSSVAVAVHLPVIEDIDRHFSQRWVKALREHAEAAGILYVDLLPELRRLSTDEAKSLFILPGGPGFARAELHYNEKGNRFISEVLYRRLMAHPTVTRALGD